jgi:hypothetical protein
MKYDPYVKRYISLEDYIKDGGLPNESMLEEQWNALPDHPGQVSNYFTELNEAKELLKTYNRWRRGEDIPQPNPVEIGKAIDKLTL